MPRLLKILPPNDLELKDFGPIRQASLNFGDLTVLVGPQASGKSILLQLLKLLEDVGHVKHEFKRAGVDWNDSLALFMDVFFGEGMRGLLHNGTEIERKGAAIGLGKWVSDNKKAKGESMFFIPAQRVLTLRDGWPMAFNYWDSGVPYTVREFSEELRLLMTDLGIADTLFPVPKRLKQEFRELLQEHIFPGFNLKIDSQRAQKRLVLTPEQDGPSLPYMVWSAGQREFVPLLLGLYHLLPSAGSPRRQGVHSVVIEELEMGLHPRAIAVVMLMVFELLARGYKVFISTHSPQVLDAIWALKHLRQAKAAPEALLKVFDAPETAPMRELARKVMSKTSKVYYFDRDGGKVRDISDLDPGLEADGESGWGGLSEFSGRANVVVADAVANAQRGGQR